MSKKEVVVEVYCQTITKFMYEDNVKVPSHWLPNAKALNVEYFLSSVRLSPTCRILIDGIFLFSFSYSDILLYSVFLFV